MDRVARWLVVVSLVLTACSPDVLQVGPPQACTMIGCISGVTVSLDSVTLDPAVTYQVEVCVDGDCDRGEVGPDAAPALGGGSVTFDASAGVVRRELGAARFEGAHQVRVRIAERGGADVVDTAVPTRFQRTQPNGPNCEPVCWVATVEV